MKNLKSIVLLTLFLIGATASVASSNGSGNFECAGSGHVVRFHLIRGSQLAMFDFRLYQVNDGQSLNPENLKLVFDSRSIQEPGGIPHGQGNVVLANYGYRGTDTNGSLGEAYFTYSGWAGAQANFSYIVWVHPGILNNTAAHSSFGNATYDNDVVVEGSGGSIGFSKCIEF